MKRAVFLPTAQQDILGIVDYIATRSGYMVVAEKYALRLQDACQKFAAIEGTIGHARPEMRPDIRSIPYENYVIFFRYIDDQFQVVNILESHRDIDGFFGGENL